MAIYFIFCFLIGFNYIYTAFFGLFFILIATIFGFLRSRNYRVIKIGSIGLAILISAIILNLLPTLIVWHNDPITAHMLNYFKRPIEADAFGLKIRNLITPSIYNPIPLLARFAADVAHNFPDLKEDVFIKIGCIGSIGLIFLFLISLCQDGFKFAKQFPFLKSLATLNLSGILLTTVGGFGSIFNLLISSEIRAYNRISGFIAYFCFCAFGILLTACFEKFSRLKKKGIIIIYTSFIVIFLFGTFDENASQIMTKHFTVQVKSYLAEKRFVEKIEARIPKSTLIFQLPIKPYPVTPSVHKMVSHDHFRAYILSKTLHWSWPPLQAKAWKWQQHLKKINSKEFIKNIYQKGFRGLWIDRFAYEDGGKKLAKQFSKILHAKPIISSNQRFYFFKLK